LLKGTPSRRVIEPPPGAPPELGLIKLPFFQRMSSQLEALEARLGAASSSLEVRLGEVGVFLEALRSVCSHNPPDLHALEALLATEVQGSSTVALLSTDAFQVRYPSGSLYSICRRIL